MQKNKKSKAKEDKKWKILRSTQNRHKDLMLYGQLMLDQEVNHMTLMKQAKNEIKII